MEACLFTDPLSPEDQYWIGYFRADGSIGRTGDRRQGHFAQARFHPVNELANHIGRPGKVKSRSVLTNYGFYIRHVIVSAEMGYRLEDLGAKSDLRSDLYLSPHFWRGMIDGDGCIKQLGVTTRLELVGSLVDVTAFSLFMSNMLGLSGLRVFPSRKIYSASVNGNKAKYALHKLYDGEYTANLTKFQKVKRLLDQPWSTHHLSWKPPIC